MPYHPLKEVLITQPDARRRSTSQPPVQPPEIQDTPQELPTASESSLSVVSDETDAQSFMTAQFLDPAAQVIPSPIALREVNPKHGPLGGGEEILLVGYGFNEVQGLLVRFGFDTEPVRTAWVNPFVLRCRLPPSESPRRVVVTLHWRDRPDVIPNEGKVFFTYDDVDKDL